MALLGTEHYLATITTDGGGGAANVRTRCKTTTDSPKKLVWQT